MAVFRLGETVAAWHRNNAQILAIETERRANWHSLILRYAEREGLDERQTQKAVRQVLDAIDEQDRGTRLVSE